MPASEPEMAGRAVSAMAATPRPAPAVWLELDRDRTPRRLFLDLEVVARLEPA